MGNWHWRKSFGRSPFRISFSKKGVGYSVGIRGLRFGRSAAGRLYVSQSIPGTGLRKITYLGGGKTAPPSTGPQATPLHGGWSGSLLSFARSVAGLTGRGLRTLAKSLVVTFDWLKTRCLSGWTSRRPSVALPLPPSLPSSSASTSAIPAPSTPPPAAASVPPPTSSPANLALTRFSGHGDR